MEIVRCQTQCNKETSSCSNR